jgi:SLA1 homology domain 1, SHD1
MKTPNLCIVVWLLSAATALGQRDMTPAEADRMEEYRGNLRRIQAEAAEAQAEYQRQLELGAKLFGVDERWTEAKTSQGKSVFAGTLYGKQAETYQIGDWGCPSCSFSSLSKVSGTEYLLMPKGSHTPILLRGFDVSKVTDRSSFVLQHPVVIQNTFSYKAVSGAQSTVLVLERNEKALTELSAKRRAEVEQGREDVEAALYRTWTDATGKFTIEAQFIDFKGGKAQLKKKDGSTIELPTGKLSQADQDFIRKALAERKKDTAPKPKPARKPAKK